MSTRQQIFEFIQENQPTSPKLISEHFAIKRVMVQRHLKNLLGEGIIERKGSAPRVFYFAKEEKIKPIMEQKVSKEDKNNLFQNWLYFSPEGERFNGFFGFQKWCEAREFPLEKMKVNYKEVVKKYSSQKKNNLIRATQKFADTFPEKTLKEAYYLDFYSLEIFGKTKLGQLVYQAKLNQDISLIKEVVEVAKDPIEQLIKKKNIEAIAFVPHSIKRETPFLPKFEKLLNISLPNIPLLKLVKDTPLAQKSLPKLSQRIENAKKTIFFDPECYPQKPYENILIIDDAVGSGATLQEVAKKAKSKNIAKNIYGFALVGSKKGFDIISEV